MSHLPHRNTTSNSVDQPHQATFADERADKGAQISADIVVVTHNSSSVLADCLAVLALGSTTEFTATLTIADAGSGDVDETASIVGSKGRVIRLPNLGYGSCANAGFYDGTAEWLVLMNPDARVPERAIVQMIELAQEHNAAAVAPLLVDAEGSVRPIAVYGLRPPWRVGPRSPVILEGRLLKVETLQGSVLVMNRECFTSVGGFDEAFFLYSEEDDLVLRMRQSGYTVGISFETRATHLAEASSTGVTGIWRNAQRLRGKFRYCSKHFSGFEATIGAFYDLARLVPGHGLGYSVKVLLTALSDPRGGGARKKQIPIRVSRESS